MLSLVSPTPWKCAATLYQFSVTENILQKYACVYWFSIFRGKLIACHEFSLTTQLQAMFADSRGKSRSTYPQIGRKKVNTYNLYPKHLSHISTQIYIQFYTTLVMRWCSMPLVECKDGVPRNHIENTLQALFILPHSTNKSIKLLSIYTSSCLQVW